MSAKRLWLCLLLFLDLLRGVNEVLSRFELVLGRLHGLLRILGWSLLHGR